MCDAYGSRGGVVCGGGVVVVWWCVVVCGGVRCDAVWCGVRVV